MVPTLTLTWQLMKFTHWMTWEQCCQNCHVSKGKEASLLCRVCNRCSDETGGAAHLPPPPPAPETQAQITVTLNQAGFQAWETTALPGCVRAAPGRGAPWRGHHRPGLHVLLDGKSKWQTQRPPFREGTCRRLWPPRVWLASGWASIPGARTLTALSVRSEHLVRDHGHGRIPRAWESTRGQRKGHKDVQI